MTGGTGSFGSAFIRHLLATEEPRSIRVYSRGEHAQVDMQRELDDPRLRFLIGDVRDLQRLSRALVDVDVVVHAAALKAIPSGQYNPFEFVQTNVIGAQNVIEASLDRGISRVMALSTDKAASPLNTYGKTKALAEALFVQGNEYGGHRTRFSVVRYGNVAGSRGSVIPLWLQQRSAGVVTITDRRMTRFHWTLQEAAVWTKQRTEDMEGGEIFIPLLPSVRIPDLAEAVAPGCRQEEVGIRPGEKLHETLISEDESRDAAEVGDLLHRPLYWRIWNKRGHGREFTYSSDVNDKWLMVEQIRSSLAGLI